MKLFFICTLVFMSFVLIAGCATHMTPSEFNTKFPRATNAKYLDHAVAQEAIYGGKCSLLVSGRKYTAPIGLTVAGDLKNGAEGVDQWVEADKGNAYRINNFEWISVGDQGATQLIIYFDTILCK